MSGVSLYDQSICVPLVLWHGCLSTRKYSQLVKHFSAIIPKHFPSSLVLLDFSLGGCEFYWQPLSYSNCAMSQKHQTHVTFWPNFTNAALLLGICVAGISWDHYRSKLLQYHAVLISRRKEVWDNVALLDSAWHISTIILLVNEQVSHKQAPSHRWTFVQQPAVWYCLMVLKCLHSAPR